MQTCSADSSRRLLCGVLLVFFFVCLVSQIQRDEIDPLNTALFAFVFVCLVPQIRDEMKTFVLAGHETSASMLNWTLYELMENADLMSKVIFAQIFVFCLRNEGTRREKTRLVESNTEVRSHWFNVTRDTRLRTESCIFIHVTM